MIPKLEKYREELTRNRRRIDALQVRNEKLEKMIAEQENLELHSLLQGANMSYQELTAYIQAKAGISKQNEDTQEDTAHEKTAHGKASAQEETLS